MKILSAKQLRAADLRTLEIQKIRSWELMERAASTLFYAIQEEFNSTETHFTVFCGPGNNGGDGLALARMLHNSGIEGKVYLLKSHNYSPDNLENQNRLKYPVIELFDSEAEFNLLPNTIIVDALYGFGMSRPLDTSFQKIIRQINQSGNTVISVDMPSGLMIDSPHNGVSPVIKADRVYTFHSTKIALLLPDNSEFIGSFRVLDIQLEDENQSIDYYTEKCDIQKLIRKADRFSHKGTFGHALIIGGSIGKIGAVNLSLRAALRTGCGLISAYIPQCGLIPLQSSFPEAMVITSEAEGCLRSFQLTADKYNAIGIGVGMGTEPETAESLLQFLNSTQLPPLVLDADALNILSKYPEQLSQLPENTILTPHPKELQHFLGLWENDYEKLEKAREFCQSNSLILIIKGANTAIVFPDKSIHFNSTGNYGMATGGSGDVLTGIITSLLAQKYSPKTAALLGVYLHGLSGDEAIKQIHPKSLIASDLIQHLSTAWFSLSDD